MSDSAAPMREVAPGVHVAGNARRVLHSGDPRGADYRNAAQAVKEIRSRLSHIRGELEDIGRIEASFEHDRLALKVANALSLALMALYALESGPRSFGARADASDVLWEDARANPDAYVIEDGETWKWRPWNIFKRGGPDANS